MLYDRNQFVFWRIPGVDESPENLTVVIVVYNDLVWPGVYANGRVIRYPEDYSPIQLSECTYWCPLPRPPVIERETQ